MTPLLKRLLIWLAVIGVLLLVYHWVHYSGVGPSPQVVNGSSVTGTYKGGWFATHPYFFPIIVVFVYILLRLYQIKKRPPTAAKKDDGLAK